MEATVHLPGEGEQIGGPSAVTIKATGEETNDSFYLGEAVVAPGFPGPPPHFHERLHDMFYVLDGTLTMRLGDYDRTLGGQLRLCASGGGPYLQQSGRRPSSLPQLQHTCGVGELHA